MERNGNEAVGTARDSAAGTIQAAVRGFLARRRFLQSQVHQRSLAASLPEQFAYALPYKRCGSSLTYRRQPIVLQAAALALQRAIRGWLCRVQLKQMKGRAAQELQFKRVLQRHRDQIQQLEREKRAILELPTNNLDAWQRRRHAAAVCIQAAWRGRLQRQRFRAQTSQAPACKEGARQMRQLALQQSENELGRAKEHSSHPTGRTLAQTPCCDDTAASTRASTSRSLEAVHSSFDVHRSAHNISTGRCQGLQRQIQQRVDAYKAALKHGAPQKAQELQSRLDALLADHITTQAEHISTARQRQRLLQHTEVLCGQLQQLPPTLDRVLDEAQLFDCGLPASHSERMARARQAHALAMAEARVGSKWWAPLKLLGHRSLHGNTQQQWQEQDCAWQKEWDRLLQVT